MKIFILFAINIVLSIQLFAQSSTISIEIFTDNYPEETYWTLEDEDGNIIDQIFAGDLICSNTYYNWVININDNTCYNFTIFDSYGDGICCSQGNGSYTLNHNNIIYTGGQFNNSEMISSICNPVIVGCIDYNASNYNALADTNIVYGGIIDPNIGSGGYYTGDQHLIFDSYVESRIVSAIIHTQYPCSATFELRDNSANVLDDTTIVVSPGGQRIYLNFDIPVGVNYELGISGNNPGIYRNNGGVSYPYDIGGLVSITGSSAGNGYYYFYYDIEIEAVCTGISSTIYGCTDPNSCNYDTNANTDDGSCLSSYGCTDPTAFNYDSLATCDDGTCIAVIYGCTDPTSCNYDTNANTDDGSCLSSYGCTDPTAFNYDSLATCDDGTCIAVIYGCTDPTSCNYDTNANTDDGSCLSSYGCTDPTAFNYDSLATCDDGTCIAVIYGCTDPTSCNCDTNANIDDGSCLSSYGCTDPNAFNYDSLATCDDGTCIAVIYGCTDPTSCNYDTNANIDDGSCSYSNDTILNISACEYYTWIDGVNYTFSNNTATYLLSNLAGCDSIVYLDLTIYQSTSDTINVVTNSNYYWNDSLYTNSGLYSSTETNIYGCDSLLTLNLTVSEFSPTVSVSLSNTYCDSLADLTISVSQDSGQVDMGSSLFQSNLGSFDIASMNYGDTIGTAFLNAGGGSISLNTYIMVSYVINSSQAIIVACDSLQGCLGTFTISNTAGGGVSIFANSVFDGNNYTSGNMSSITFENCFINPCGLLSFTTTINSEFGDTDIQIFDYNIILANNFSPTVSVSLSNTYCDSLADLTISVSQDSGQVDMGSSLFQSNLGSFDIASMNYGDTIGTAFLNAGGGSISLNTYIMVSYVINSSQAIIVACDSLQGCLGTFTISNTAGGGVSIFANSVFDGNNYTSGNMSSITFENCFINPCGLLSFTTTINSEFGDTDIQIFDYNIILANNFSPTVSVSLSNTYCDSLADLTISVSQDSGQVDMGSSLFQSNLGSFDIASMNYGDTIGTAFLNAGGGSISLNTYIMVSYVINSSQAIIVACDSLQGCLGTFTISNTAGGGVSIFANSVFDGNNYTSGNMSSITFENCFINPCGLLSFTTTINSEFGDTDIQIFDYILTSLTKVNDIESMTNDKVLIRVIDILSREEAVKTNKILFYIYDDGTVEKKIVIE